MLQSSLALALASVPRRHGARKGELIRPAAGGTGYTASRWVRLRLPVSSSHVLTLRQWLHSILGNVA